MPPFQRGEAMLYASGDTAMGERVVRADFRQAVVKGGAVVLTLEVPADAQGAFDVVRMAGRPVVVAVAPVQPELELGDE